ncbi:MAG: hypothetical protein RBU45_22670, partial [Myxococcota bacterium]|nr:hypothetical protein [Myxococcota bacterium]
MRLALCGSLALLLAGSALLPTEAEAAPKVPPKKAAPAKKAAPPKIELAPELLQRVQETLAEALASRDAVAQ